MGRFVEFNQTHGRGRIALNADHVVEVRPMSDLYVEPLDDEDEESGKVRRSMIVAWGPHNRECYEVVGSMPFVVARLNGEEA